MAIRSIVRPIPGVRRLSLLRQRIQFTSSAKFWDQRYAHGGTSGSGSYGDLAFAKAEFLNNFVQERKVRSVVEFGCGDGNQLSLAKYGTYVGLDVSRAAIRLCRRRFEKDPSKSFFLYDGDCFMDRAGLFAADLSISLDVIYHLVENSIFETYMTHLFGAGQRYVIIYATNSLTHDDAPHVKHRVFSTWVEDNYPEWCLTQSSCPNGADPRRADFFVYELA